MSSIVGRTISLEGELECQLRPHMSDTPEYQDRMVLGDSLQGSSLRPSFLDTQSFSAAGLRRRRECWTCRWIRLSLASLLSRAWNTSFAFT
jgi:hypothetical protein